MVYIVLRFNKMTPLYNTPQVKDSIFNKYVTKAVIDLFADAKNVDILTITNYLHKIGKLQKIGGSTEILRRINKAYDAR